MLEITTFKCYKPGVLPGLPVFALYDPVGDCFLTVLPNKNVAQYLKYILLSRYHLHICQLDSADNYLDGMITNKNCQQWSLSNKHDIRFSDPILPAITSAQQLCATNEAPSYNVFKEKLWCLFCVHCLYIVYNEHDVGRNPQTDSNWQHSKLDQYLNSFLNITQVTYPWAPISDEVRLKVLKILYLERDFDTAEAEIRKLIDFI